MGTTVRDMPITIFKEKRIVRVDRSAIWNMVKLEFGQKFQNRSSVLEFHFQDDIGTGLVHIYCLLLQLLL